MPTKLWVDWLFRCFCAFFAFALLCTSLRAEDERKAVITKISKNYDQLNKLNNLSFKKHGYPFPKGVLSLVTAAVDMGIFYEGQSLYDAVRVFGEAHKLRKEWLIAQLDADKWLLVPLEVHYSKIKDIMTEGTQWHLALKIDDKNLTIKGIRLEYLSGKILTLKNIKYDSFKNSKLEEKLKQDTSRRGIKKK